jgi:hypothetical protein
MKSYIEGKFYKDHFSENAVKNAAKYTLVLKRGKKKNGEVGDFAMWR